MKFMALFSKKTWGYIFSLLTLVIIAIAAWFLPPLYFTWKENRMLAHYATDTEKKIFVDWIRNDWRDLAANPDQRKRIAATMDVGLQWYNLLEYESAARWWKKGLEIEPNNVIGWYNLGNAYRELKKYNNAENAYHESIRRAREGEIDACLALGEMYRYLYEKKKDQEPSVYLSCLVKHKENRDLIARLAIYYRDIGNRQNAVIYFDRLWRIEPTQDVADELRKLQQP